jgi:hypothetical protein
VWIDIDDAIRIYARYARGSARSEALRLPERPRIACGKGGLVGGRSLGRGRSRASPLDA